MKKLLIAIAGICLVSFVAGSAMADSAKFAATYDTDTVFVKAIWEGGDPVEVGPVAEMELATLHVAQWKEILIGVSGQVNLVTLTEAKGKNADGVSTAKAEGTVLTGVLVVPEGQGEGACVDAWTAWRELLVHQGWDACIEACGEDEECEEECGVKPPAGENLFAAPGPVTFASRMQELSVNVDLDTTDPLIDVTGYVTVGLTLDTTAAHHFNFIADDLTQGRYDVIACYDLTALADANNVDNSAYAYAGIGPRILTVQEVRATKNGIIDETGIEE